MEGHWRLSGEFFTKFGPSFISQSLVIDLFRLERAGTVILRLQFRDIEVSYEEFADEFLGEMSKLAKLRDATRMK